MPGTVAQRIKQQKSFASDEHEVLLGLQIAASRVIEPWALFLKAGVKLTVSQYNVLRILRGSHPTRVTCSEIGDRMLTRDPDVTRLVDRLARRGLVDRIRSRADRRVVLVGITEKGLDLLKRLDPTVDRLPKAMLGHLGSEKLLQLRSLLESVMTYPAEFP